MQAARACLRRSSLNRPLAAPRCLHPHPTGSTARSWPALATGCPRSLSTTTPRTTPARVFEPTKSELKLAKERWEPPACCPGCGAPSQRVDEKLPGYYPPTPRKSLLTAWIQKEKKPDVADELWKESLERVKDNPELLEALGGTDLGYDSIRDKKLEKASKPIIPHCERCHSILKHNHAPAPVQYPSLDNLSALLLASPHKYNHIYHLIDASDFPATLHRGLRNHLHKTLPNRITHKLTVSYIVTRADILMRQRDQITSLMTYFKNTIKDHIPEWEKVEQPGAPLHVISTRNGWDLGKLKEEIQERIGGVWFVGAVNVGKSSLLREVWPEGGVVRDVTIADAAEFDILPDPESLEAYKNKKLREYVDDEPICSTPEDRELSMDEILNQARHSGEEPSSAAIQVAPAISEVPGTTMAPIRVGYKTKGRGGKFRGEIVDLPGIERWCGFPEHGLMKYVRPEVLKEVPMKKRPQVTQVTVKPGQALLLGGLAMITPKSPDWIVLMNPFVHVSAHVAGVRKQHRHLSHPDPAKGFTDSHTLLQDPSKIGIIEPSFQWNTDGTKVENEFPPLPEKYRLAGTYAISEDVTAKRNPMLEKTSQAELDKLPYKVFATDIVLEGMGWVEVSVQVKRNRETGEWPKVEVDVHSLEGKGVMQRRCMNAYPILMEGAREAGKLRKSKRPRPSKKGEKKAMKLAKRAAQ